MQSGHSDLIEAVGSGALRRPALAELSGYEYFVDAGGRVYSMNNEEPRIVDAKTGWGGLDWVVLMTRDGWRRYFVGELIAEAFLGEQRPGVREDYTVVHIDGDARNNAALNLRWVTRLEANRHRQNGSRARLDPRESVVHPAAHRPAAVAGATKGPAMARSASVPRSSSARFSGILTPLLVTILRISAGRVAPSAWAHCRGTSRWRWKRSFS